MIKAGVVGATGYTGEELIEVLLRNPEVEITSLSRRMDNEAKFSDLYPRFAKKISLICRKLDVNDVAEKSDIVFLALPHTSSMQVAPEFLKKGKRIIDLSADYRLPADTYEKWYGTPHTDKENLGAAVYGLPELNRELIKKALLVSNPGCYPTSVILALLPIVKLLADNGLEVISDSKSGTTGAGRKAMMPLSFSEVDENFKCYKPNEHQHMPEMEHVLSTAATSAIKVNFVPHLLPLRRGILSTIYVRHEGLPSETEIHDKYVKAYSNEPFVRVRPLGQMPEIQDVAGSNFCDVGIKVAGGMLVIVSVIDNLLKGASGQAVQNMNLMFGLDEKLGLI